MNIIDQTIGYIKSFQWGLIEIIYLASVILLVSGIAFFVFVIFSRERKRRKAAIKAVLVESCQGFISELVFEDELSEEGMELEKFFLANKFRKQILMDELLRLHKNVQGELAKFIETYYMDNGLYSMSFAKINSGKKHLVIDGLLELSEMNAKSAIRGINKLFRTIKDSVMKQHFLEFMIKQEPDLGINQLLNSDIFLSDWEQIKILNLMKDNKLTDVPALSEWLAKGDTRAIFGCRLVAYTQNHSEVPSLLRLLTTHNEDLRIASLRTLAVLEAKEANEDLIANYLSETKRVKHEILKTLSRFEQETNLSFFAKCRASSSDEIRHLAINAINKLKLGKNIFGKRNSEGSYNIQSELKLVG